jgi:hypothetical protein
MECKKNGKSAVQEVLLTDHTTPPVELFFIKQLDVDSLASATAINDTSIDLVDATGFSDGDYIGIFAPASDRFYFGEQVGAPVGNTISLDTPLDFAFQSGSNVLRSTRNLAVDGSIDTQIFAVQGSGNPSSLLKIDVTRIILTMEGPNSAPDGVAFDTSTFGNIAGGLTYGLAFREVNGRTTNLWNAKTNGELAGVCYDVRIDSGARAGTDGLAMRKTYAGQDKSGTALRLRAGDSLQFLVQDNLTDLDFIRVVAEGHIAD